MKTLLSVILFFTSLAIHCQTESFKAQQYYNRVMDKVFRKDHKGVIYDFPEAVKLDSGFIEAYKNRGLARYYRGDKNNGCAYLA